MNSNKLIAAAIAAGVSVGLSFAPTASSADPAPTGQQGFFVPGIGGGTDPQRYVHPDVPFPMHVLNRRSVDSLITSIKENGTPYEEFGDFVHILCYDEGCAVVHKVKPAFQEGGELEDYRLFDVTTYRDPYNADGGHYTKMPWFTPVNDYPDVKYEFTITHRYDRVSDAQDKPGLLAYLNSVAAAMYYGNDYGFEQLQDAINDGRVVVTTTVDDDGNTRSHYLLDDPDRGLPLTKMFRDVSLAFNNDAGDIKVHQFWDGVDSSLKPHIDSKYDTGPDPDVNQREVSTVNGAPVAPEEEGVEEAAEQSSFSAPDDNQASSRSAAMSGDDDDVGRHRQKTDEDEELVTETDEKTAEEESQEDVEAEGNEGDETRVDTSEPAGDPDAGSETTG